MVMIAEKLRVLWHVLVGGVEKHPPCSLHTVLQAAAYRVKGDFGDDLSIQISGLENANLDTSPSLAFLSIKKVLGITEGKICQREIKHPYLHVACGVNYTPNPFTSPRRANVYIFMLPAVNYFPFHL